MDGHDFPFIDLKASILTPVIGRWYPLKVRRAVMYVNDLDWEVEQSHT